MTANEEGFQDGVRAAGSPITFAVFDLQGDARQLPTVLERVQASRTDLFYVSTATVLKALLDKIRQTPVIFRVDSHAATHDVSEQLKRTYANTTGICNGVQFLVQQRGMEKLLPIRRLGVIYDPLHADAVADRNFLRQVATQEGFTLIDVTASEVSQIPAALHTLAQAKVDVLYLPPDPFVMRHSKEIVQRATQQRMPTFTGMERLVLESGALFALVSNSYELGKRAAQQAERIFNGDSPTAIPVEHSLNFAPVINLETAKALDIKIPVSVLLAAKRVKAPPSQ